MGSNDVPPAHCPSWVVPTSTALLGVGVLFWDATYILMTRRALVTKSYGMPLLALALNVSWELVYAFYVSEMLLEKLAFAFWLLLDIGLIYTTVQFGPEAWRLTNPWVGRNIGWIFALMTVVGCWGHSAFAAWWMSEPHRGSGDKTGKFWAGRDGYDATEVAFWSAAVCQLAGSAGSLAMLISRGHSGGTSYLIWYVFFFCTDAWTWQTVYAVRIRVRDRDKDCSADICEFASRHRFTYNALTALKDPITLTDITKRH